MCKAPLVPRGAPVVNSLFRQRAAIENLLRACVGLPPNSHLALEHRVSAIKSLLCSLSMILNYRFSGFFFQCDLKINDNDGMPYAKIVNGIVKNGTH